MSNVKLYMTKRRKRQNKLLRKINFETKKIKRIQESKIEKNPVKKERKEKIKRRKNFFASFLLIILLWLLMGLFVYFVNPDVFIAKIVFFVFLFATLVFTFSFAFTSTRRGVLAASTVTMFLILRLLGVGNVINLILLTGLVVCIDYYLTHS